MSLSASEIRQIVRVLSPDIVGARLSRSYQPSEDRVVLELRTPAKTRLWLLLAASSGRTRMSSIPARPPNPRAPHAFQMLLRKEVDGRRIDAIEPLGDDRVVQIVLGDRTIVVELTGRTGNVFLVGVDDRVLGSLIPGDRKPLRAAPESPSRFDDATVDVDIRELYARLDTEAVFGAAKTATVTAVRRELKKHRRRASAVDKDLERAHEAQIYQRYGEALKAALHEVDKGAETVTLTDYSTGEPVELEVPLRPELSAKENMERFFRLHRKYRDAVRRIEDRLAETNARVAELSGLLDRAEKAEDTHQLDAIVGKLPKRARPRPPGKRRQPPPGKADDFHTFFSASGLRILVGKDARRNDALTFRHARGNDVWMHVKAYPGSHVVIPLERKQTADLEALLDAAALAVSYSKAPDQGEVEVGYTAVKNVRKPKGVAPGIVTYRGEKTLFVGADPERLKRLRERIL